MKINAIRLVKIGKIVAIVDIQTSEGFIIKGFKVVQGDNGLFVGMPSEKTRSGKYIDTVNISDSSLKEMLESIILDEYQKKNKNISKKAALEKEP
jgi:stage V sporulation protein G